jgi:hypothetical protein
MNEPKQYKSAGAFRRALEARLLAQSLKEGVDIQRLRRKVAFDRLLARLFANVEKESPWVLKGGYAMELRIQSARTTKDIDLTLRSGRVTASDADQQNKQLRELVQEFSSTSLPDYFQFLVGQAMLELGGAPEGGYRYPIEARMDGRLFTRFHLDIGIGDEILAPLEVINGADWLGFVGIAPPSFPVLSREQQWAEKFHAYTRPRAGRQNSRVKDLVDLLLLGEKAGMSKEKLRHAVEATFARRKTHPIPNSIEPPPAEWQNPFEALAEECQLQVDLTQAGQAVTEFWHSISV